VPESDNGGGVLHPYSYVWQVGVGGSLLRAARRVTAGLDLASGLGMSSPVGSGMGLWIFFCFFTD
jgi:hypothetical protein